MKNAVESLIRSSSLRWRIDQKSQDDVEWNDLGAVLRLLGEGSPDDCDAYRELAGAMPALAPLDASCLAFRIGAYVERGGNPELAGAAIAEKAREQLKIVAQLIPMMLEGRKFRQNLTDVPGITPRQDEAAEALESLAQSLVSHLAHWPELHARMRADAEFNQLLESLHMRHVGAHWLHGALTRRSGELLVLVPEQGLGFRVAYRNVANNFHLFTLLHEVIGGALGCDLAGREDACNAAHGGEWVPANVTDTAIWDFSHWGPHRGNPLAFLPGEQSTETIPQLDGVAVVVLWPRTIHRSWDSNFFKPKLEQFFPDAEVREHLTPEEAKRWIDRATSDTPGAKGG